MKNTTLTLAAGSVIKNRITQKKYIVLEVKQNCVFAISCYDGFRFVFTLDVCEPTGENVDVSWYEGGAIPPVQF